MMLRLLRNFSCLGFGELISKGFYYGYIVYLTRVLGVEGFGIISFAQAFISYFILIVNFGFDIIGIREISKDHTKLDKFVSNILLLRSFTALASLLVIFFLLQTMAIPQTTRVIILVYGLYLLILAFSIEWIFQASEKMMGVAFLRIFRTSFLLLFVVLFVKNYGRITIVPLGTAIAELAGVFFSLLLYASHYRRWVKFEFDWSCLKYLLRESLPVFLTFFMAAIYYNIDILFLAYYRDSYTVGIYSAAYKVVIVGILPINLWLQSAMPMLSRNPFNSKIFHKFACTNLSIGLSISLFIFLESDFIIMTLYGQKYAHAIDILMYLSFVPLASAFAGTFANVLSPWCLQKQQLYSTSLGAIANILANFALIPRFGMKGAAAATIGAELVVGMAALFFCYQILYKEKSRFDRAFDT